MEARTINDGLSVSKQLGLAEIREAAKAGFRSVMVNRPDGEGDDQPTFAEVEAAAKKAGMKAAYVPVSPGKISDDDVAAFAQALEDLPSPVIGYCRTGTRTTTLWALANAGSKSVPEILGTGKAAGYDLSVALNRQWRQSPDRARRRGPPGGDRRRQGCRHRSGSQHAGTGARHRDRHHRSGRRSLLSAGWTLVGAGRVTAEQTRRELDALIPRASNVSRRAWSLSTQTTMR